MLDCAPILLAAEVPVWSLVITAALGVLATLGAALVGPWGEGITRKDELRSYKRNIYRNFLDHGYWFVHGDAADEKEHHRRAVHYVADWHRMVTSLEVV